MINTMYKIIIFNLLCCFVHGHGKLTKPPSRNHLSNDDCPHCLNTGGLGVMVDQNKITRGLCGNSKNEIQTWNIPGDIVQEYKKGQSIPVSVLITAHHMGYFVVEICNSPDISEECFKPLCVTGTNCYSHWKTPTKGENFYNFMSDYKGEFIENGVQEFTWNVDLPKDLECSHCVLRWIYYTTNSCPKYNDDKLPIFSEQFINCADISIGKGIKQSVPGIENKLPIPIDSDNFICPHKNPGYCKVYTEQEQEQEQEPRCLECLWDYGVGTRCLHETSKYMCNSWDENSLEYESFTWLE